MIDWKITPFSECIVRHEVKRQNQINNSEIKAVGRFPVIDQGQSFIAGYTNDEERVIYNGLPYVIFGDHTRCFKFVDFPFVLGADGTKVLKPDKARFDSKFFYFALINQKIPSRGYNRHFKLLKESSVPHPADTWEQKKIASLLTLVQRAIEQQERLIALTTELKKALMHKLFTEGTRGEKQKQTEIGPVPESWGVARLGDIAESFQYGTSVKCNYEIDGMPVLRIPNVVGGHVDISDLKFGILKRNELELLKLNYGDLLFVRTNGVKENAGRCSMYRGEFNNDCYFASYLIRVRIPFDKLLPEFVDEYSRTSTGVSLLSGRAIRTADGKFNINSGTLKEMLVPTPKADEQSEITETAFLINQKLFNHVEKRLQLIDLFRTLLHQLMTAQIRVNDLDLTELDYEPITTVREEVI